MMRRWALAGAGLAMIWTLAACGERGAEDGARNDADAVVETAANDASSDETAHPDGGNGAGSIHVPDPATPSVHETTIEDLPEVGAGGDVEGASALDGVELPDLDEDALNNAARLASVLDDPRRDEDRARDDWRHPAETLSFFGVTPDMRVAEVLPGGGWYTRVLAPLVADRGAYMALNYPMALLETRAGGSLTDEQRGEAEAWGAGFEAQLSEWAPPSLEVMGAYRLADVPEEYQGQLDAILYMRALHHLNRYGFLDQAAAESFALLRSGGVVGVVQHRAPETASDDYVTGANGYMRESDVIAAFEAAGFELAERSEINANLADTADHEGGVWMLAPAGRAEGADAARFAAIGESDRMTLLFRKP